MKNLIKAWIAGSALPSLVLPFVLCLALRLDRPQVLNIPFLHFIPLIWGVWNILYFLILKKILPGDANTRLLLAGALLGLFIAAYAIFDLNIPSLLGIPEALRYVPLVLAPIVYAILWRFIVKPLNELVGLSEGIH